VFKENESKKAKEIPFFNVSKLQQKTSRVLTEADANQRSRRFLRRNPSTANASKSRFFSPNQY
jgi:hypothetical protein